MKKCYCTALLNTFRQANIWSFFKHSGCTLSIFFTNKIYSGSSRCVWCTQAFFFFLKEKPHASCDAWNSVFEMLWSGVVSPPLWLGTLQSLIQLWSLHHIKGCLSAWKYRLKSRNGPFKNTMILSTLKNTPRSDSKQEKKWRAVDILVKRESLLTVKALGVIWSKHIKGNCAISN